MTAKAKKAAKPAGASGAGAGKEREARFMELALALARKGAGFTGPNPLVGAVVVKAGKIIARGHHARHGREHAEVVALRRAGKRARGATLYCTLEPCCHWGYQPPCTLAVIASGVKKVVYAMGDPNPAVNGKGHQELVKAGLKVETGLLAEEAKELNKAYVKRVKTGLPYVLLKVAASADGKIAGQKGKWITGERARKEVHRLRAEADVVLTSINTVLRDNPRMNARVKGARQPVRVVLDSRLRLPLDARLLKQPGPVMVFTTPKASPKKIRALERKGVEVDLVKAENERVYLLEVLKELGSRKMNLALVEAGQTLGSQLLALGLVDELALFVAPATIGKKGLNAFDEQALAGKRIRLWDAELRKLGKDWLLRAKVAVN